MGEENQPSKKRAAGRELSRDNPGLDDDEDVGEQEIGTFKKASDEVLATRKIVKVRRQTSTASSAPTANPFAGIRLVPPPLAPSPASTLAPTPAPAAAEAQTVEDEAAADDPETKDDATTEPEEKIAESKEKPPEVDQPIPPSEVDQPIPPPQVDQPNPPPEVDQPEQAVGDVVENVGEGKPDDEVGAENTNGDAPPNEKQVLDDKTEKDDKKEIEKTVDSNGTPLNSFQQLSSSQNAFTGLGGTGFSSSSFSFGSIQKDGSPSQSSPSFSFGTSNNGSTSLFGIIGTGSSIGVKTDSSSTFAPLQEGPRETGEENEETVFSADSALFEFFEGGWKERGKGELKVNVSKGETHKARLVMRAKGNLRLILNARLYPDLKLTKMEKKGITFACVNSANEGKDSLSTFALKFKDSSIVEEFSSVVSAHKGTPSEAAAAAAAVKTPENSPKATED